MIHCLPLSTRRIALARARLPLALAASWPPTLMWIGGIALCLLVALATLPRSAWADDAPGVPIAAAFAEVPPVVAPARARARCTTCGVVESIRQIEATDAQPAAYEFTVRLRDGSARVSTSVGSTAWAVGDPIMLLGGT